MTPYADRETQLEYLKDYYATYRVEHAEEIRARQSEWLKARRPAATVMQRMKRYMARCEPGLRTLTERDKLSLRAAILAWATDPNLPDAVLRSLVASVSDSGVEAFLAGLESTRERNRWEWVFFGEE